jgi:hypothetical protein
MAQKVTNGLDLQNQKIINHADPSAATDVANKQYVDAVARGLNWKPAVRAASTAAGTLATSFEDGDTLDGVVLATGDRILIKDQATAADNGIYVVVASGAPTRAVDMAAASDAKGAVVTVTNGTANGDKVFNQTTEPATVGTHDLAFSQLGGGTSYTAGDGLTLTGSDFDVVPGAGLEISADTVRIAAAAAGAGLTGGAGSALAVGAGTGVTVNADDVAVDTAVVVRKYAGNVGDNAATAIVITHSLGTRDCTVAVYRATTPWDVVLCDVEMTSTTTVTLRFATAPTSNEYRVVVHA